MRRNPQLKAMGARTAIEREPLRLFRAWQTMWRLFGTGLRWARPTTDQAKLKALWHGQVVASAELRGRREITESSGVTLLPLRVMPGEGPVSTSCSAGLGKGVDAGPSPGMTA